MAETPQDPYANLENADIMLSKVEEITAALQAQQEMGAQSGAQWNAAFKDVADQSATAASNWGGVVDGSKKLKDIQKDISNNKKIGNSLLMKQKQFVGEISNSKAQEKEIMAALQSGDKDRVASLTGLKDEQLKLLAASQDGVKANQANNAVLQQQQKAIKESYTNTVKGLQMIGDVAGKLGLQGISDAFLDGSEAARQAKLEGGGFFKQMAAAGKEMVFVAAQALLTATILAALEFNTQITELKTTLGLSAEEAMAMKKEFKDAMYDSDSLAVNTKRMQENLMEINKGMGFQLKVSGENLATSVKLSEYYGLQGKQLKGINDISILTGKSQGKVKNEVLDVVAARRNETGLLIDVKKTMQEVGDVSGYLKASMGGSATAIAEAVTNAAALGMTLEGTAKIADSLLNFESSIQNELEAELLTGKEINLEKARMYALTNDYVGLQNEVASQVGSLAEFNLLNRLQAEAMAKAFGMTKDEMSEMLMTQEIAGRSAEELTAAGRKDLAKMVEQKDLQGDLNDMIERMKIMFVEEVGPFIEDFVMKMKDQLPEAMETIKEKIEMFGEKFKTLNLSKFLEKRTWITIGEKITSFINPIARFAKIAAGIWLTMRGVQATMMLIKGIQIGMNVLKGVYLGYMALEKGYKNSALAMENKGLVKSIGQAVFKAISSLASIPVIGWALGLAAGATIIGMGAKYMFADGGIVPGGSETGDNVPVQVNSGEMILNKEQQGNLFAMAQGGGGGGETTVVESSGGTAEVVMDSFNLSSYGNMGRMNEKYQNPYLA